jgi:hypothetical protein
MRHTKRSHDQVVALQNSDGLCAGGINDIDVERGDATDTSECRSQHPEYAGPLIEQLVQECSKGGNIGVPRGLLERERLDLDSGASVPIPSVASCPTHSARCRSFAFQRRSTIRIGSSS